MNLNLIVRCLRFRVLDKTAENLISLEVLSSIWGPVIFSLKPEFSVLADLQHQNSQRSISSTLSGRTGHSIPRPPTSCSIATLEENVAGSTLGPDLIDPDLAAPTDVRFLQVRLMVTMLEFSKDIWSSPKFVADSGMTTQTKALSSSSAMVVPASLAATGAPYTATQAATALTVRSPRSLKSSNKIVGVSKSDRGMHLRSTTFSGSTPNGYGQGGSLPLLPATDVHPAPSWKSADNLPGLKEHPEADVASEGSLMDDDERAQREQMYYHHAAYRGRLRAAAIEKRDSNTRSSDFKSTDSGLVADGPFVSQDLQPVESAANKVHGLPPKPHSKSFDEGFASVDTIVGALSRKSSLGSENQGTSVSPSASPKCQRSGSMRIARKPVNYVLEDY
jgi:hypothetical protein